MSNFAPLTRHTTVPALLCLALVAPSWPALAQNIAAPPNQPAQPQSEIGLAPTSPLSRPDAHDQDQSQDDDSSKSKPQTPPPSLPGSHAEPTAVAPADKDVADLNPTDVLFDAINRGDITAARDALNRGADVNGKNVLGQTPLAASVDLGRNDISFLLLSMRTASQPATVAEVQSSGRTAASASSRGMSNTFDHPGLATTPPVPGAGFLGFGGS